MEKDIKILKGFLEECKHELMLTKNCWALEMKEVLPRMCFNENTVQALENILNRLEQDERIINNVTSHLEYYLIGRLDLEDSQEEFKKLLKMLKRD